MDGANFLANGNKYCLNIFLNKKSELFWSKYSKFKTGGFCQILNNKKSMCVFLHFLYEAKFSRLRFDIFCNSKLSSLFYFSKVPANGFLISCLL